MTYVRHWRIHNLSFLSKPRFLRGWLLTRSPMKTMERFSNSWLTIRMLGIWSGVAPDCERLDGLCRVEARAAVFACCTTGARMQTRFTSSFCLAKESGLISRRYRFASWRST